MRNKRRELWFALLVAFLGGLVWLALFHRPEPTYQGKSANYWVRQPLVRLNWSPPDTNTETILAAIREIGRPAVPYLVADLRRKDSFLKMQYRAIWPKLPAWYRKRYEKPRDPAELRSEAFHKISEIGPFAKEAVPDLILCLKDPQSCLVAVQTLSFMGIAAKPAGPELLKILQGTNQSLHLFAATALANMGPQDEPTRIAMAQALLKTPWIDLGFADMPLRLFPFFSQTGLHNDQELEIMLTFSKNPKTWGHHFVAMMIGKYGPSAARAVPTLLEMMNETDPAAHNLAMEALGEIGPPAHEAVPQLREAMQETNRLAKFCATAALARVNQETNLAIETCRAALGDAIIDQRADPALTYRALKVLSEIGPPAISIKPQIDALLHRYADKGQGRPDQFATTTLRLAVARVIWKVEQDPNRATDICIDILKDKRDPFGGDSLYTALLLNEIGPPAKAAAPMLVAALKDKNSWVRTAAAWALVHVDSEAAAKAGIK